MLSEWTLSQELEKGRFACFFGQGYLNIVQDPGENDDDHLLEWGLSHAAFNEQCIGSANALGTRVQYQTRNTMQ